LHAVAVNIPVAARLLTNGLGVVVAVVVDCVVGGKGVTVLQDGCKLLSTTRLFKIIIFLKIISATYIHNRV
jgi:hypothetical protein